MVYVSMREHLMEKLQVNVASITIAALFIVVALSWVETFRAFCSAVLQGDKDEKRYDVTLKKLLVSSCVTLIFAFVVVLIYIGTRNKINNS